MQNNSGSTTGLLHPLQAGLPPLNQYSVKIQILEEDSSVSNTSSFPGISQVSGSGKVQFQLLILQLKLFTQKAAGLVNR